MRIIGLAGWSGAGKTTLLTRIIPHLTGQGLRVATIKHAPHAFDVDVPGKDSYEHRRAGAAQVLVSSARRWALMTELRDDAEPDLNFLLSRLNPADLVIVEGFKREPHPKIEVFRLANGKPWLHPDDPWIKAVAADAVPQGIEHVALNDPAGLASLAWRLSVPLNSIDPAIGPTPALPIKAGR